MSTKQQTAVERLRAQINERLEEELAKQFRAIPQMVEDAVRGAVLRILGIKKGSRGYGVDTFGSNNSLNAYIQRKVTEGMDKLVEPLVIAELERIMKFKTLPRNISEQSARAAEWAFESRFRDQLKKKFEKLADRHVERISEQLDKAVEGVGEFNNDLFDPNSYESKIGELFLEEIAEQLAEND